MSEFRAWWWSKPWQAWFPVLREPFRRRRGYFDVSLDRRLWVRLLGPKRLPFGFPSADDDDDALGGVREPRRPRPGSDLSAAPRL